MSEALVVQRSLSELAAVANREHELANGAWNDALGHAISVGNALLEARERVPRGQWTKWLDENCSFKQWAARTYMRLSTYQDRIPSEFGYQQAIVHLRGLPQWDGQRDGTSYPDEMREEASRLREQGLTQREVGTRLGIDHKTVCRWEGGDTQRAREQAEAREQTEREEQRRRGAELTIRAIGGKVAEAYQATVRAKAALREARSDYGPHTPADRELTAALYRLSEVERHIRDAVGVSE